MSTSARGAKRQRCIEQEDDNQSKITFEGIYVIDDFGPIIPSLSGDIDPMEADLHSRESISAVHKLEFPSYGSHGWYASSCGRVLASAAWFFTSIQQDREVQVINKVWECAKVPSCHQSCENSLFGMKFTQVPSQYSNRFAEQTRSPNNPVAFCFIMVQRDGQKQSWMTS
jgi:hypothetical protein